MAVVEFVNALGSWVEESLLKQLHKAPFFLASWLMNALIEELTICCHWVESGVPEEQFIEILPLKNANAESIYSALVEYAEKRRFSWEAYRNEI